MQISQLLLMGRLPHTTKINPPCLQFKLFSGISLFSFRVDPVHFSDIKRQNRVFFFWGGAVAVSKQNTGIIGFLSNEI
jgi:hypothetical protein